MAVFKNNFAIYTELVTDLRFRAVFIAVDISSFEKSTTIFKFLSVYICVIILRECNFVKDIAWNGYCKIHVIVT